jgi:hypothetical protein
MGVRQPCAKGARSLGIATGTARKSIGRPNTNNKIVERRRRRQQNCGPHSCASQTNTTIGTEIMSDLSDPRISVPSFQNNFGEKLRTAGMCSDIELSQALGQRIASDSMKPTRADLI